MHQEYTQNTVLFHEQSQYYRVIKTLLNDFKHSGFTEGTLYNTYTK
jgi:hypothetical protein